MTIQGQAKGPALILITDPAFSDERILQVTRAAAGALPPGALAVQLRDKTAEPERLRTLALRLREVTQAAGARLLLNGNATLAKSVQADGVHLGTNTGTVALARATLGRDDAWVTVPAHDDADVARAAQAGASAVLVSPIGTVPGKGAPRGIAAVSSARAIADGSPRPLAVYALGGIDARLAEECRQAGAAGVAVIRALLQAEDPAAVARSLVDPAWGG